MKKLFLYPAACILLIIVSRLFSHHLMFGHSIACVLLAFVSLGIFAWKCDKQSEKH